MRLAREKKLSKPPDSYAKLAELLATDMKLSYGSSDPLPNSGEEAEPFFQTTLNSPHGDTLVFASPSLLEKCLKTAKKAKVDATFKVLARKPKGRQLLTIHATRGVNTFPVVYALMESKKKAAYRQLFEYLHLLCPDWKPEEIMMDFEKGLRDAFKEVYPDCKVLGCYFHYAQAIQKNWSQHGLMKIKKSLSNEARDLKRSILALAFGKAEDIPNVYDEITKNLSLHLLRKVQPFLNNYYTKTWLSDNNRCFKPTDFSVCGFPDRTNNHLESFHSRLHLTRPKLWVFLKLLIFINVETRQNFGRVNNGIEITPKIPVKILFNGQRVKNARELFEAGRLSAYQFIMWCRTSVTATLAIARQGRRLKIFILANCNKTEYDEVATSSDSSVKSFDWEYNPNPNEQERKENEDEDYDMQWEQDLAPPEVSDSSVPDSTDSIWNGDAEDAELQLVQAAVEADDEPTPNVPVPRNVEASPGAPQSCLVCLTEPAIVIASDCGHALVCLGCKPFYYQDFCTRCNRFFEKLITVIST